MHINDTKLGLRAARVKVIFTPTTALTKESTPLAYIEWFRPFSARDQNTNMFTIMRSTRRDGEAHAQIIPVKDIVLSCHLQPVAGTTLDSRWSFSLVLDQCEKFFFNHYLHLLMFDIFDSP
jgi:hypothetical protein